MTDALLVLRKLGVLRDHVARVRRRRPDDIAAFADVDVQDAVGMSLLVAIQKASDIALHIVAKKTDDRLRRHIWQTRAPLSARERGASGGA